MAREALSLAGVNAFYGDSHVLHDVSFALGEGRVLALLGRNGAGKTTCIYTIVGLLPARSGALSVFGESIGGLAPEAIARKGVGLVPQGRRIFPSLSVRENLTVAARGGGRLGPRARSTTPSRGCASASGRGRARSPAASSRCSPSPAR